MADEIKEETIEFNEKTDTIPVNVECPNCGDHYTTGTHYVNVSCNKCGARYRSDFKMDIYSKKARFINLKFGFNNQINFKATEKYIGALTQVKEDFIKQNCWDITDIEQAEETYRYCTRCGVCFSCFACKKCGLTFSRDENRRRLICPHCRSDSFTKTNFTEAIFTEGEHKRKCPHCKSDNIKMTLTKKEVCEKCGSDKLTETRRNTIYIFTIKRKKAYYRKQSKKEET